MGHHTNFYYGVVSGPTVGPDENGMSFTPYKCVEDMRFYDCFGVGSEHDETILRSYNQTIEFLSKNYHYFPGDYEDEDIPELDSILRGKVKLFFDEHPNGIITFG